MYLFILFLCITGTGIVFGDETKTVDEVEEFDKILRDENGLVVLFTQSCCACTDCVEAEVLVGGLSKELEDSLGLLVVRLKDPILKARYGIKKVPALAYIRDNKTALYDGKFELETLYSWLQDNRQPSTVDLDDSSFEHLTQAASGATTGDWLVMFHDGTCCKNREMIKLENAGIKLRNKVNVASVNTLLAPETAERFNVNTCPHIILFRHQKMYRFSLPDITTKTLRTFAESFYKNSKAESVPIPPSSFDKFLDKTIQFCNDHWHSLIIILAATTVCTALFMICATIKPPTHTKSD
ncbi:thioredoxin domain-containing protein [Caerostris extrusa]|uniref:Thioredoxin domain-containing protein n=1 Tax=Caerostris extrusa TaxID=172846 RepID=A0AAV4PCR1_CAEEX|nr:thioredoxin domain-containing protein [Caerostris extrusa]